MRRVIIGIIVLMLLSNCGILQSIEMDRQYIKSDFPNGAINFFKDEDGVFYIIRDVNGNIWLAKHDKIFRKQLSYYKIMDKK